MPEANRIDSSDANQCISRKRILCCTTYLFNIAGIKLTHEDNNISVHVI